MKALCSERYEDWSNKFGPMGLKCREVTGDSELEDYFEIQDTHIVMTTPVSFKKYKKVKIIDIQYISILIFFTRTHCSL